MSDVFLVLSGSTGTDHSALDYADLKEAIKHCKGFFKCSGQDWLLRAPTAYHSFWKGNIYTHFGI